MANIYSFLLGIETNSSTRRTKSDGIFGKGAFGTCMSLYGPHETQSRGGLHSHVNAWGSIPPSLLQKAIEDAHLLPNINKNFNVSIVPSVFINPKEFW